MKIELTKLLGGAPHAGVVKGKQPAKGFAVALAESMTPQKTGHVVPERARSEKSPLGRTTERSGKEQPELPHAEVGMIAVEQPTARLAQEHAQVVVLQNLAPAKVEKVEREALTLTPTLSRGRGGLVGASESSEPARPAPLRASKHSGHLDEVLLASRALAPDARGSSLFDTKKPEQKAQHPAIGAEQLVTRVQGTREHHRVTAPVQPARNDERRKAEPVVDKKQDDERKVELAEKREPEPLQQHPASPQDTFQLDAPAPVQAAAPLAPLAPVMLDDASLRAVLLPTVARVSLETGEGERLHLQLKVQDGVTELRATGPAASLIDQRQGELRVALAKEGLALGHFDLSQGGSPGQQHADRPTLDELTPSSARRAAKSTAESTVAHDGRLHVKV